MNEDSIEMDPLFLYSLLILALLVQACFFFILKVSPILSCLLVLCLMTPLLFLLVRLLLTPLLTMTKKAKELAAGRLEQEERVFADRKNGEISRRRSPR